MGLSTLLTGIVNFITLILSVILLGVGIWLATKEDTDCVKFLELPFIVIGAVMFVVSLAGFIGACYVLPWLLFVYLLMMFVIILALLVFVIFAAVVTKDGPAAQSDRRSYNLQDYSPWLRSQVTSSGSWAKIRNCIKDSKVCADMVQDYRTAAAFYSADLSSIESGCCMPPAICGYTIAGPTTWNAPATNLGAEDDCLRWSNDQGVLCYSCDSCRAGVIANVKREWRKVEVLSVVVLVIVIVMYAVGCCAFRHAHSEELLKHYDAPYLSRAWRRSHWFRSSRAY